ncbi:MAG: transcription termination/antitermination factor NusG [Oscillospiraceae bacterium]|nr:transcription termination/antitermination factor NusG [Oscillospiraceae bacterium]
MDEQNKKPQWYIAHTYSGYENKVAQDLATMVENRRLQDLICDIKIPTEMVPEIKTKKVKEKDGTTKTVTVEEMVERKIFPGYVMVKMIMTDETWYIVRNTRGCTGFVGPEPNKPVPLTDAEVENMGIESDTPIEAVVTVEFKVGDTVQITAGPLEGFMGKVEEIDIEARKVKLKVNMFGRETPAEVELGQVELL